MMLGKDIKIGDIFYHKYIKTYGTVVKTYLYKERIHFNILWFDEMEIENRYCYKDFVFLKKIY